MECIEQIKQQWQYAEEPGMRMSTELCLPLQKCGRCGRNAFWWWDNRPVWNLLFDPSCHSEDWCFVKASCLPPGPCPLLEKAS